MVRRFAAHRTKKRNGSNTLSEEKDLEDMMVDLAKKHNALPSKNNSKRKE